MDSSSLGGTSDVLANTHQHMGSLITVENCSCQVNPTTVPLPISSSDSTSDEDNNPSGENQNGWNWLIDHPTNLIICNPNARVQDIKLVKVLCFVVMFLCRNQPLQKNPYKISTGS